MWDKEKRWERSEANQTRVKETPACQKPSKLLTKPSVLRCLRPSLSEHKLKANHPASVKSLSSVYHGVILLKGKGMQRVVKTLSRVCLPAKNPSPCWMRGRRLLCSIWQAWPPLLAPLLPRSFPQPLRLAQLPSFAITLRNWTVVLRRTKSIDKRIHGEKYRVKCF